MNHSKYRSVLDNIPVAILILDYSPVLKLAKKLQSQTVTNVRKFLAEHHNAVISTFKEVRLIDANDTAYKLYEATNRQTLLNGLIKTFTLSAVDVLVEQFVSFLEGEMDFTGEFKSKTLHGRFYDIFVKVSVPQKYRKTFSQVIMTMQDITNWKRLERQLRKRAQLDGLTKLLNHNTIMQRLEEELIRAKRYGLSLSCLMIDLDHFKIINDKFGHQRGDQILKRVATLIKNCVRKLDHVGRYGGDEFLLILPETRPYLARYAALRIQKIFSTMMFKYQKTITFRISLSIGITGYPSKKVKESRDLIALADRAMYEAKKTGRNRIALI